MIKRFFASLLVVVLGISLCACGGDKNDKGNTSTSSQTTEEDSVDKNLTNNDLINMSVEDMKKYYNAEELVGTPMMEYHYVSSTGSDAKTFKVSREMYDDMGRVTFKKEYHVDNTIQLGECDFACYSIFVDNNTPDDYEDDQFAFVFYWVYR